MAQRDPWAEFADAPGVAPPLRQVVGPQARQVTPQTPEQAAGTVAQTRRDTVMADRAGLPEGYDIGPDGLPRPMPNTPAASAQERGGLTANEYLNVRRRYNALRGFDRSIRGVEQLFNQSFAGERGGILGMGSETNVAGRLPGILRPENQTFEAASQQIIDQVAEVFGITGGELNSLAELRARLGPYLPAPTDNDQTIQYKLNSLRALFNEQRNFLEGQVREEDRVNFGQAPGQPPQQEGQPPTGPDPRFTNQGLTEQATETPALTDEQQQRFRNFLAANPQATPDQINAFTEGLGIGSVVNATELVEAVRQGRLIGPLVQQPVDISDARGTPEGQAFGTALGAISPFFGALNRTTGSAESSPALIRGAMDTGSFGWADEAAAAVSSLLGGNYDEALRYQRALNAYDEQNNTGARIGGQILGAAAFPMPAGAARGAGYAAYRVALTRQALAGAGYGAVYGFGSGDGDAGERFANALLYAGVGGAAPVVLTGAGRAAGNLGRGARALGQAVRGVPPNNPVTGATPVEVGQAMLDESIGGARAIADPSRRGNVTIAETTLPGHPIVRTAMADTREQLAERVRNLGGLGTVQDTQTAGSTFPRAGERSIRAHRRLAGRYYDQAEQQAERVGVVPTEAVATLTRAIDDLAGNPNQNRAVIDYLTSVRADLANSAGVARRKTVAQMRDIRTGMSGEINRLGLTRTNAERIMNGVLHSAARDIARDLGQAAPNALRMYQQGDELWRRASVDERQIVQRLFGGDAQNPISGEQVLQNVRTMMSTRGDAQRFQRLMSMLTPAERANFRATIADPMGRTAPDMPFQPGTFVQQTNGLGEAQLRQVFGPDGARSIQNLRLIARGFTDMSASLNNSRSGFVMARQAVGGFLNWRSSLGGVLGFMAAGPVGGVAGAAAGSVAKLTGQYLAARSLMNPDVSRWMLRITRANNPEQVRQAMGQLRSIIQRQTRENPAIARELAELSGVLTRAANDNGIAVTTRAAASPGEGGRERRQEQP